MGNSNSVLDDAGFPGSAILESFNPCGDLATTEPSPKAENRTYINEKLFQESEYQGFINNVEERDENPTLGQQSQPNRASAMLAKALVNEVTNNPNTMTPTAMAERERRLMKAQQKANLRSKSGDSSKIVGIPGGVGQPSILGSIAHALTGQADPLPNIEETKASLFPPNSTMSQNRAQIEDTLPDPVLGEHSITIGLCLSRRSSVGNDNTITRQTAFDFNELQDREYNYVSSTDKNGWRAGGGERGGAPMVSTVGEERSVSSASGAASQKVPAPDVVHIPIIQIDAESSEMIDQIIAVLASGDIFIPHMSIIPEALSVEGVSPPNLVVRFGTERNEDFPPDQWQNWCLEFMHNQLFEYFQDVGAIWGKRPFSITLAKEVRWKTVKHMNRYFAHAERVIDAWREKGPQFLDPQLAYMNASSTPEEVSRPHGIYLFRNGVPSNYFAPNFDPPYSTNMTRNLLLNVLNKSWDQKRREWTSKPTPRLVTPTMLIGAMLGCSDNMAGGFLANEVTVSSNTANLSFLPESSSIRSNRTIDRVVMESVNENNSKRPPTPKKKQSSTPRSVTPKSATPNTVFQESKPVVESRRAEESRQEEVDALLAEEDWAPGNEEDETPSEYTSFNDELELKVIDIDGKTHKSKKTLDEILMDSPTDKATSSGPLPMHRQISHTTDATDKQTNLSSTQQQLIQAANDEQRTPENHESPRPQLISDDDWFDDMGHPIQTPGAREEKPPMNLNLIASAGEESAASYSIVFEDVSGDMFDSRTMDVDEVAETLHHIDQEFEPTIPAPAPKKPQQLPPTPNADRVETPEVESRQDMLPEETEEGSDRTREQPSEREQVVTDLENYLPLNQLYGKHQLDSPHTPGRKSHIDSYQNQSAVSPLSMEYSMDSTNFGDKSSYTHQSGSLLGQHLSEPTKPVQTHNKSLLTTVTQEARPEEVVQTDSEDSTEIVPSDEELFNVGWAKALDPNSGSYYYFTLDRSKIVWDNPLAPGTLHTRPSMDTAGSSLLI